MIINIILIILCWSIAAIFNAVMDVLKDRFDSSIFRNFDSYKNTLIGKYWWDPRYSWKNKYKDRDPKKGPKFIGSTTVFVFLTDAWHLAQFGMLSFIVLTIIAGITIQVCLNVWWSLLLFIILKIIWGVTFELTYQYFINNKLKKWKK